jgi:hypothetical protein
MVEKGYTEQYNLSSQLWPVMLVNVEESMAANFDCKLVPVTTWSN